MLIFFFFFGGGGMFSVRNDRIQLGDCFCDFSSRKRILARKGTCNLQFLLLV